MSSMIYLHNHLICVDGTKARKESLDRANVAKIHIGDLVYLRMPQTWQVLAIDLNIM